MRIVLGLAGVLYVGASAGADIITANNIPDPPGWTSFRWDVGYTSGNDQFPNTSVGQPFAAAVGGPLTTITTLVWRWAGGDPLRVAVHRDAAGLPGESLGFVEFDGALLRPLSEAFDPRPLTTLDMSSAHIALDAGSRYHVVFTTASASPVPPGARYSLSQLPVSELSFNLPLVTSRDSISYSIWTLNPGEELGLRVAVAPAPGAASLVSLGLLWVGGRRRR